MSNFQLAMNFYRVCGECKGGGGRGGGMLAFSKHYCVQGPDGLQNLVSQEHVQCWY